MKTDTYQIVTDLIIKKLEEGTVPWKHYSNVKASEGSPRNLISNKPYHGTNYFLLSMMGYRSPFWLTYKQAKELGGNVRKGETGMPIVYWNFLKVEDKETGKPKDIPFLRYYTGFNAEQCEGIEGKIPDLPKPRETHLNEEAEQIIKNMPKAPEIELGPFPGACYMPVQDKIRMTQAGMCVSDEIYYDTLFHELTHSTGHESRLNRDAEMKGYHPFGSREYSREELIAEMGAAFLCAEVGISQATIDNSASYINGWLKVLKGDPKFVVAAAGKAQKSTDFILNRKT